MPLGISGGALMLWSLLAFPHIIRRLGARATALLGLYVLTVVSLVLGSISFLAGAHISHGAVLAVLVVVECVKACFQQLCFPTSMVRLLSRAHMRLPLGFCCNGRLLLTES